MLSSSRAERRHRHAERDAGALAAERVELHGVRRRGPGLPHGRGAGGDLLAGLARHAHAREVALDVGGEDGDAVGAELFGHQLEGLGLARAGRAGDQAVPVEHAERDPDVGVAEVGRVEHQPAELQRRALELVTRGDGGDDGIRVAGAVGTGAGSGADVMVGSVVTCCRSALAEPAGAAYLPP